MVARAGSLPGWIADGDARAGCRADAGILEPGVHCRLRPAGRALVCAALRIVRRLHQLYYGDWTPGTASIARLRHSDMVRTSLPGSGVGRAGLSYPIQWFVCR